MQLLMAGMESDRSAPVEALRRAVEAIGGQAATARLLGITQPAVSLWLSKGQVLPAEHVLTVERETGVSRHDLRPDIYPREAAPSAGAGGLEAVR
jgi:DNA-binding transcriptional regulator YdaS (Cro superfamily)